MYKKTGLVALTALLAGSSAAYAGPIVDTTPDGAKYQLQYSNVGSLYTFTFIADFTGVTTTPPLNTYALAFSIASVPGSVEWSAGSISQTPGAESKFGLYQGVVSNSNGCPAASITPEKDWCVGLKSLASQTDGVVDPLTKITNTSVLTFVTTMTLASGTPDFTGDWSYKFVTTTGNSTLVTPLPKNKNTPADPPYYEWEFGHYQISRTLTPCASSDPKCEIPGGPDPSVPDGGMTLALLGSSLVGLGLLRRKIGF